ncbi:MAG: molybdopterin-binding protein [Anaerolineaceae bacterium]|nr:molybdopterin-binding protein [Anaerolineaceae bacterium]MCB9101078.1 molybdopterin-binding protein [Anaerolineales bacterium]
MKVIKIRINEAVGHVLIHNQAGPDGRRVLRKGTVLTPEDGETLLSLGQTDVYVGVLDEDDIHEDQAARRLGDLLAAAGLTTSNAATGRVNLIAETRGLFTVDVEGLLAFNDRPGITLATLPNNTPVQPKKVLGTIKIIPYSVPQAELKAAEAVVRERCPLAAIKPFTVNQAVLITTGSEAARDKVAGSFTGPLRERLAEFGAELVDGPYVAEDEQAISQAIQAALDGEVEMILIAGETSIMDTDDITPRAIKAVGGEIVHHGVPVEPGNLFMLAYHGNIPIVGAPGCARSKSYNVIDMVLPRLAAGERLTRSDLVQLGHGGYLK